MRHVPFAPFAAGPGRPQSGSIPGQLRDLVPTSARLYAIIDASLVPNLPEMLAASGLRHCCLFLIDHKPELADSAPWLMQLDEDSRFTRSLFTESDAAWHLWGRHAITLLTSTQDIEQLRETLRRFTRVQDEQQRWYYWRFWDARALLGFLAEAEFSALATRFLQSLAGLSEPARLFLPDADGVTMVECRPGDLTDRNDDSMVARLTQTDRLILRTELRQRDASSLARFLKTLPLLGQSDDDYLSGLALRALIKRDQLGIRSPNGIAWMIILLFMSDRHQRAARLLPKLISSRKWNFDQIARMLRHRAITSRKDE